MSVRVELMEDGGNPQDPSAIERLGEGHYRVFPYSEDGDGNYKFACNVRLVNEDSVPQPLTLEVDWADAQYMNARRFLYLGAGDHWQFVPADISGTVATVSHSVPPGVSYAGQSPAYALADYEAFAARLPEMDTAGRWLARATRDARSTPTRSAKAPTPYWSPPGIIPTRPPAPSAWRG